MTVRCLPLFFPFYTWLTFFRCHPYSSAWGLAVAINNCHDKEVLISSCRAVSTDLTLWFSIFSQQFRVVCDSGNTLHIGHSFRTEENYTFSAPSLGTEDTPCRCLWNSTDVGLVTRIVPYLKWWNIKFCGFLSPLPFSQGQQCCNAVVCACSESSSSLSALPCHPADQLWSVLCLPPHMPVQYLWFWNGKRSGSTKGGHGFTSVRAAQLIRQFHCLHLVHWTCQNDDTRDLCITLGHQPMYCNCVKASISTIWQEVVKNCGKCELSVLPDELTQALLGIMLLRTGK